MQKHLYLYLLLGYGLFSALKTEGQILYFTYGSPVQGGPPNNVFYKVDLATCEVCPVLDLPDGVFGTGESLILPGGDILYSSSLTGLVRYDPPNPVPMAIIPGIGALGAYVHPNGTIYLAAGLDFYSFNPVNNTVTFIGTFNTSPTPCSVYNMFFQNGQLYGFAGCPGNSVVLQINVVNPAASTIVMTNVNPSYVSSATSTPNGNVYTSSNGSIFLYNVVTNTSTLVCDLFPSIPSFNVIGLTNAPAGTADLPCNCLSTAATPFQTTENPCVPNPASVSFNNNASIFPYEVIRYILYTDPANPIGSTIQNNPTPNFNFIPPIQVNIPYYVSQVVGTNVNGNFNPQGACNQVSAPVTVTWRNKPTVVSLASAADPLCPGSCQSVTVTLGGTSPFLFVWQWQQGGNVLGLPAQIVFNGSSNPHTFLACVPLGTSGGEVQLVICNVNDAFCTNP